MFVGTFLSPPFVHEAAVGAVAAAPSYAFYNNPTTPTTSTTTGGRGCRCCLASAKHGSSQPGLLLLTGLSLAWQNDWQIEKQFTAKDEDDEEDEEEDEKDGKTPREAGLEFEGDI